MHGASLGIRFGAWSLEPFHRGRGGCDHVDGKRVGYSRHAKPAEIDWSGLGVDLVIDCTGKFKTEAALQPYFDAGVKKVLVSAPVPEPALNVVYGINHHQYDPATHHIVTAASCTTNCLAPVVKVMHEGIGIRHGTMTTIHDITNTQTIVDAGHKDLRRARACGQSLIPTSTGSATAITKIFPELTGKLNGLAVRVPLLNASLTDFVFEASRKTTVEEVNALFKAAAEGALKGILGYEEASAGVGRLQGRSTFVDCRCAVDDGHRRHSGQGAGLVRQRMGLCEPHDGTRGDGAGAHR